MLPPLRLLLAWGLDWHVVETLVVQAVIVVRVQTRPHPHGDAFDRSLAGGVLVLYEPYRTMSTIQPRSSDAVAIESHP
jgi:hypothetical protein